MSLKERLGDDLKAALRAGDRTRLDCLRMLRARILEQEVALRPQRGAACELSDDEVVQVLTGYAKQRREAIESFRSGGREELAAREEAELAVVQSYLPRQLEEAEVRAIVRQAIVETGATSTRDLGAVMKQVMPRVQGAADGKLVNRLVREELGG